RLLRWLSPQADVNGQACEPARTLQFVPQRVMGAASHLRRNSAGRPVNNKARQVTINPPAPYRNRGPEPGAQVCHCAVTNDSPLQGVREPATSSRAPLRAAEPA